jgi:hypothetical protein
MVEQKQVLIDNGDGTVTDTKAGLMWQKDDAGPVNWEEAMEASKDLSLAGHTDWRLPTLREAEALFKASSDDDHVIDRRLPPLQWRSDRYWTSKVAEPYHAAFLVNYNGGSKPWEAKNKKFYFRAVRPTE